MNHSGPVDQDDILRARNVLLASGRRTPREEVDACRVLARVSPASYLPRLVRALLRLSYDRYYADRHEACLALLDEAVAAARALDPVEPHRLDLECRALQAQQRELYAIGRRAEGLAVRAELLTAGRAKAAADGASVPAGLSLWANGLSEEGRHAEAAAALTECVTGLRPKGSCSGAFAWTLLEWAGALDAAGRSDDALAAFEELVEMEAEEEAMNDSGPRVCYLFALIRYAQMLESRDRRQPAAAARQEALALLAELAATGGRTSLGGYEISYWAVLLSLSGAESERFAPGEPRPPFGAAPHQWSPDAQRRYFDGLDVLRGQVDAVAGRDPDDALRQLPERIRVQRTLTVRSAVHAEFRGHLFANQVRPLFNEGVDLARQLAAADQGVGTAALVRALEDRSAFHIASMEFASALADFREAVLL
ncbi:hypothetical protein P8605_05725 [Streptomyces sp. T-3]|nr:hypothetical protein [Streptomyces sp. T-3]